MSQRDWGNGGYYQVGTSNTWVAWLSFPTPDGGHKRRVKKITEPNKKRAKIRCETELKHLQRLRDEGIQPASGDWTVETWIRHWIDTIVKTTRSPGTVDTYTQRLGARIAPALGRIRLAELTAEDIDRWITQMVQDGLASSTIKSHLTVLRGALDVAAKRGHVEARIIQGIAAPRQARGTIRKLPLTLEQADAVLDYAWDAHPALAVAWTLGLWAGFREGEIAGLRWTDVTPPTVKIRGQIRRYTWEHGCGEFTNGRWPCCRRRGASCPRRYRFLPPDYDAVHIRGGLWWAPTKTVNSNRDLPMSVKVQEALVRWWPIQRQLWDDPTWVVTDPKGQCAIPAKLNDWWKKDLAAVGIDPARRSLHAARGSFATFLLEAGVDQPTQVGLMGHSKYQTTELYITVRDEHMAEAMSKVDQLAKPPAQIGPPTTP
ncbi:MAG: site-specific integrase [Bifidobacteriaceae bacterium]|jgi:integrase|nr:site-specific integrase [Bifidobacteriaceae bacterium]